MAYILSRWWKIESKSFSGFVYNVPGEQPGKSQNKYFLFLVYEISKQSRNSERVR